MPLALCLRSVFALLVVCVLTSALALAQTGTATLSGAIQDPKGAVVPDVEVVATRIETGTRIATKTNGAGIYVLTGLMPGHYHLLIHRAGFKEIAIKEFELHVQDKLEQNFSLEIGSVSETVTVSANNEQMATDNPAVGLLVNHTFVENIPLNGRSFQDLIALTPGTVSDANQANNGLFSINGQRGDANYFTVDGVSANTNAPTPNSSIGGSFPGGADPRGQAGVLPAQTALGTTQSLISLDALQEFKIQTTSYAAENGRQPGGQIELTSRSGTNDIHGSLYDYFRNEALDANGWVFNHFGIPKQPERQNDFGGTLGGPLRIPRLYDGKGKTFYFVSYEGLRLKLPGFAGTQQVPTLAFRQFASPQWQPFLQAEPLPNGPDYGDLCAASLNPSLTFPCAASFSAPVGNINSIDSTSARIDQIIGQRWQVFGRFSDVPSSATLFSPGNGQISKLVTSQNVYAWTIGSTWRISETLVHELRFNWGENTGRQIYTPTTIGGAVPFPISSLVPPQYSPAGTVIGNSFTTISVPDPVFGTLTFESPSYGSLGTSLRQINLVTSLTWTHGSHGFKFGADFRRLRSQVNLGQYSVIFNAASVGSVQQGLVDFGGSQVWQPARPIFTNLSLFAEDNWKLTSRLTFNYGIRWEFNPVPGASDGLYPLALTTGNVAQAQLAPPGTPQYHTTYGNFAPRVGVAYQLNSSARHTTVIRGGFGIFYDTAQNLGAAGYYGYPFTAFSFVSSVALPVPPSLIAPANLNTPLVPPYGQFFGVQANDPDLKLPYTESWSLSASEGLGSKNTLTASYVGNAGKRLLFTQQYYVDGVSPIPQNPLFAFLQITSNAASSSYEAFQLQDQGYVLPGMQIIASYTWAHALDNASSDTPSSPPRRGNSDNDIRQVFNAALIQQIPGVSSNRFIRALTDGWNLSERFTAQSGIPLNVCQGFFVAGLGIRNCIYPDLVPNEPVVLRGAAADGPFGWALNPAAFEPVPLNPDGTPVREGTELRNYVHGPGFWNLTTGLQRDFPFTERLGLIFRVDAFNIFNHPNAVATNPDCLCFGSSFGKIVGTASFGVPNALYATGAARSVQLSLKLHF